MNAPKKIWWAQNNPYWINESVVGNETAYVRADIVDELVKALKSISETVVYADEGGHDEVAECVSIAQAALKELQKE